MKKTVKILLFTLLTLVLVACGNDTNGDAEGSGDNDETYEWNLGFNTAEDSVRGVAAETFKEIVEEETDGRVSISIYAGETLGSEAEMLEQVNSGALAMQLAGGGGMQNYIPEYSVLALPFMVEDFDEAYAVLDGEIGDELRGLAEEQGFKVLAHTDLGFAQITNNVRPISMPEDLAGVQIRSPEEPTSIEAFTQLGANVSTMAFTEVYMGLQQGVIDGQFNPLDAIYENNIHEVQDYLTLTNHFYYHVNFIMNNDLFNSLDSELQEIVLNAAEEAEKASREYTQEKDEEMLSILEDEFEDIVTDPDLEAFQEAIDYEAFHEFVGGDIIERTQEFLDDYRAN
ncbi:C4-dicarboxylate ABC transporter [Oceanobacillus oncorhynchi subsp. incaldanensis]|uniref:2,3-diketo-L-gulonate-binding periplasmic protein YiaO n=1 Tax=Oceanobacillus oncorhynchi TaxID=545501 RepID=A0A0A1MKU7_9BACI|nr:TRAP transporter substrate-binding protein [Oceanobacillus oncorhynchi]GIO20233.1 C4-dicarboxylate ABC transporter [Oceanobacillus oncorhynchi subsp. incaldanensis]CEI80484.1 2,3-diketo-L-gulonate-binding periplasmic protein YiaO precursor [Oceanobacillus oncorhynchi]